MGWYGDEIRFRDANRILLRNGFTPTTCKGSHQKYERDGRHLTIRRLGVNRMIWQRLIKEYKLNTKV